ncbi:uncharacterized protein LOC135286502 [Passer domesticus]|uniref:uncharacterized protein LOC135286502 n=1 Tax=Passer domesticus TaxID=48849 RepID=UPI0030FE7051
MRRARGVALPALAVLIIVAVVRARVQQEPFLETTEGTGINITCSHSNIQTTDFIYWYRQFPGRGPELFVSIHKDSKELPDSAGRVWVSADRRRSALWLGRPRRGDAAVYYCALGPRAEEPGLRPGTNRRGRGRAGPAGGAAGARLRSSFRCPEPARTGTASDREKARTLPACLPSVLLLLLLLTSIPSLTPFWEYSSTLSRKKK